MSLFIATTFCRHTNYGVVRRTKSNIILYLSSQSLNKKVHYTTRRSNSTIQKDSDDKSEIFYEGPFAGMSTRLKAVSITSAVVGAFGVPTLLFIYSGDVSQLGQFAVGGTATAAACGSTVLVHYFFTPYVHTLERIHVNRAIDETTSEPTSNQKNLIKATWRNLFVMKQETIFDPSIDVTPYDGNRPFCNFFVKGIPLYVHPELVMDDTVRKNLLGETAEQFNMPDKENRSDDEDELKK
mmetsp:Transcript_24792/g.36695  ORF Transcript_24792/g.36695 Transcript_24792/m.36695 type:complete len:239 (+) Transcript_24792:93-809(+)